MPLPSQGFDPTESGVPWRVLTGLGHEVVFATPDGRPGVADEAMVTGQSLGLLAPVLRADGNGRAAYAAMVGSAAFLAPISYEAIAGRGFDAVVLAGGHAKGMRPYLESGILQGVVAGFFERGQVVGAICHGVVLAARSVGAGGKSVLYGRRTTALLKSQELLAWTLTRLFLGDYYRTYPVTVEDEVRGVLARGEDFVRGPLGFSRDTPARADGFVVVDGNYVSARWPGDAFAFAGAVGRALG